MIVRAMLILFAALVSDKAVAHAALTVPQPRNNRTDLKIALCDEGARTATPTALRPGQLITASFSETINHPVRFYIELCEDVESYEPWTRLVTLVHDQDGVGDLPHRFTAEVRLPGTPCEGCTLRLMQSMEEDPSKPRLYYSCTDIRLVPKASGPTSALDTAENDAISRDR